MHDSAQAAQKWNIWLATSHRGRILQVINLELLCLHIFYYLAGFFDDAKKDFQQALKLNPNFEDAKLSLQQTLLDQQQKINRGYWKLINYRVHMIIVSEAGC